MKGEDVWHFEQRTCFEKRKIFVRNFGHTLSKNDRQIAQMTAQWARKETRFPI